MTKLNTHYKIGLRALKSSLAVFLCFLVDLVLHGDNVFYSAIAAIICMQPTPEKSIDVGINRFIGTLIGGLLGFIILKAADYIPYYEHTYLLVIPLSMLIAIYICNVIDKKDSVSICCVVYLSVVTNFARTIPSTELYVIDRIIETTIGILIAVIVNKEIKGCPDGGTNTPALDGAPAAEKEPEPQK